jgi:hypothetical protein
VTKPDRLAGSIDSAPLTSSIDSRRFFGVRLLLV